MLKLTKTGIGLLTKQYRSILRKCLLLNLGLFLFSTSAYGSFNEVMTWGGVATYGWFDEVKHYDAYWATKPEGINTTFDCTSFGCGYYTNAANVVTTGPYTPTNAGYGETIQIHKLMYASNHYNYSSADEALITINSTLKAVSNSLYNYYYTKTEADARYVKIIGDSIIGGLSSSADGILSVTIGQNSQTHDSGDISLGYGAKSSGFSSVSIGDNSNAYVNYSIAIGMHAYASEESSIALGRNSTANESNVLSVGHSIGDYNFTGETTYSSNLYRRIVNMAEGIGDHDAVTVSQLGNIAAGTKILNANGESAITFGMGSGQTTVGTAISTLANQLYNYYYTKTEADARYLRNNSTAEGSIATGMNSSATGVYSYAIGAYSNVLSENSVAIGTWSYVGEDAAWSVALGRSSVATEEKTVSVGASDHNLFRRIVNVAEGSGTHDAVTVSQLGNIAAGTKILNANSENAITFGTGSGQTTVGTAISTLANQLYNYYYTKTEADARYAVLNGGNTFTGTQYFNNYLNSRIAELFSNTQNAASFNLRSADGTIGVSLYDYNNSGNLNLYSNGELLTVLSASSFTLNGSAISATGIVADAIQNSTALITSGGLYDALNYYYTFRVDERAEVIEFTEELNDDILSFKMKELQFQNPTRLGAFIKCDEACPRLSERFSLSLSQEQMLKNDASVDAGTFSICSLQIENVNEKLSNVFAA